MGRNLRARCGGCWEHGCSGLREAASDRWLHGMSIARPHKRRVIATQSFEAKACNPSQMVGSTASWAWPGAKSENTGSGKCENTDENTHESRDLTARIPGNAIKALIAGAQKRGIMLRAGGLAGKYRFVIYHSKRVSRGGTLYSRCPLYNRGLRCLSSWDVRLRPCRRAGCVSE